MSECPICGDSFTGLHDCPEATTDENPYVLADYREKYTND